MLSTKNSFYISVVLLLSLLMGLAMTMRTARAAGPATIVYDAIPDPLPPNVASLGFQATSTSEFGDYIHLAGTDRLLSTVTVTMSDWALYSDYTSDIRYSGDSTNWTHPITVNIYNVIAGAPNTAGTLLATVTQTSTIPWRPEADPTCPGGTAWRAGDSQCYNGYAFNLTFDLSGLNVTLPNDIIVGVAYSTQTYGAVPIGSNGPYNSLNVGIPNGQTANVGTDDNPDNVFWDTVYPGYTAGFKEDTVWAPNGTVNFQITAAPVPPDCTGTTDCYVDDDGNDANGGASFADPKKTIQAGINAVAGGGTVHVAPGTYNESPNINKSLTLESSTGRDVTIIQLQSGPTYLGALTIDGATVTVDGFTIVGFDAVGTGLANSNILVTNLPDTVVIENNRIQVGNIGSGSNGDDGIGLLTTYSETSDVDSLTVTDNIFEPLNSVGSRAFYVNPGVNEFVFQGNEITGQFDGTAITQAKDGLVEENTVTGAGAAGSRSAGLGTWGYPDPTDYGHTIFRKNTIDGTRGISIYEAEDVTVENNFLSNNDYGVSVRTVIPLAFDVSTIHINGNSITNSHFFGVYKDASVTGLVDASANWWGTNTAAGVAAEVSADVDYTPWLNASTDTSADPGFQGDFSYLNVDDDSPQTGTTARIQEGVNTVSGSTVHVVAGTYVEQVVITIDLTIFGDGPATTFIQAPTTLPDASNATSTIVDINGAGVQVDISEFTIQGPGPSSCGSIGAGIFVRGSAYANIHDNHILDIRDDEPGPTAPFSGCQNGVGIVVGRALFSTNGSADITDNLIKGYQKNGIVVSNTASSATVTDNVVTGFGSQTEIAQNGIQISSGAVGTVTGNMVKDHLCDHASCGPDPLSDSQSAGILLFAPGSGVVISDNIISNNDIGAYNYAPGVITTISENTLTGNRYSGIFLDEGNATVSANELSGTSDVGILAVSFGGVSGNSQGTLTNNKITDAGVGIKLIDDNGSDSFIPTVIAHLNSIDGNTAGFDNPTASVDAEDNWWGDVSGPSGVGPGSGDTVSANVDFDPWLCDGTDTSTDIGFQPNPDHSPCASKVTVIKVTDPNDPQDFGFDIDGDTIADYVLDDDVDITNSNTFTFNVNPGDFIAVRELPVAGWSPTSIVCDDDDSTGSPGERRAIVNVSLGEHVTCTFTNQHSGYVTVIKDSVPNHAQDFGFDITGDDIADHILDDDADGTNSNSFTFEVIPGTFIEVSENPVAGWDLTDVVCDDDDSYTSTGEHRAIPEVEPGETVTCTFTNTTDHGSIIVQKETNPDGDTTADFTFSTSYDADGFVLSDGEQNDSGDIAPGTYSITETPATGWKLVSIICNSSSGGSEDFRAISLQSGETVTCTFTNRKQVSLTVIKDATPADGTNFTFLTTIPLHSLFFLDDAAVDDNDGITDTFSLFIDPGNYTIIESVKDGWNLTGINCVTSDPNTGVTTVNNVAFLITSVGETVTCTFTNVKRGTITVVKDAVEETGTDFTINLGGDTTATATLDDANPDDSDGIDSDFTFSLPPGDYTLSEVIPAAWNLNSLVCTTDDDEDVTVTTNLAEIALDAGENVTCTFTNERKKATITVIKDANPADGTNFTFLTTIPLHSLFFLDDAAVDDNDGITDTATFVVFPGSYTILESVPGGWNLTSLTCVSSDPATGTTVVNNVAFFVAGGNETITCTFTNVKRGSITIVKDATPEDGTDFSFTGELGNFLLDDDADGTLPNQLTFNVLPDTYTVSETVPAGWNLASATCTDGSPVSAIEASAGEVIICTFTNVEESGSITIIKDAVPDDAQDFSFTGSDPIGSFSLDDDANVALPNQQTFAVVPGSYSFQEDSVSGWDLTAIDCQTNDLNDTTSVDLTSSLVTIDLDDSENITCTFSNVKRGKITVIKDAEPADGTDFTISVGGDGAGNILLDDIVPQDGDIADTDETISFVPGDYTLTELNTPGWNLASLVCSTDDPDNDVSVAPNLATIPLEAGENVTCTFTNVRESGSITIIKDATPDNAQDFSFSAGDPINSFSLDDDADGTLLNQQTFTVVPGSYSFQEDSVPGWDLTAIDCQTNDLNDTTSADLSSSLLTVDLDDGENITCTFTNVKRGKITVVKDADPADGTNFTISVGGDGAGNIVLDDAVPDDGDANQSSESVLFAPGSYTLTELVPAGWNLASLSCETTDTGEPVTVTPNLATIHLDTGEEVTCTFINKKRGQIIVDKVTVPGGQTQVFTFTTTGAGYAGFSLTDTAAPNDQELVPGTYSVSETVPTGWDLTSATCDGGNSPAAISLQAAQTVTCVFTNTQRGSITIIKDAVPDDNQIFDFGGDLGNFSLVDNGLVPNFTTFSNLAPGPYSVSEIVPAGWDLTGLNCNDLNGSANLNTATATINLDSGETVTCTFTNDPLPAISVTKTASPTSVNEPGGVVTFTVSVDNDSVEVITLDSLTDTVHGDLDGQGTCAIGGTIAAGASYTCSFMATVSGNAGDTETDVVTATASDDEGNQATNNDDATVTIADIASSILVTKTADPTEVAEPGGNVTFTVRVDNTSLVDSVSIGTLSDDVHGDLDGQGDCAVPQTIAAGGFYECTFNASVFGNAGDSETDVVTASGIDDDGNPVTDSDDATVTITDVSSSILVTKTADPTEVAEPGGTVNFTVRVDNTSTADSVTIDTLSDTIHGDLDGQGDCAVPQTIAAGGFYECSLSAIVSGNAGDFETDVVTASGTDDDGNPVSDEDDATVTITDTLPDITVQKDNDANGDTTFTDNEQTNPGATVTFQVTITNNTDEAVTIDSLSDSIHDLTGSDCASLTGMILAANGSVTCTFTGTLANQFNLLEVNEVTVVARDDEGNIGEAKDTSTVTTPAPGSITIIKEAEPESNQVFNFSGTLGSFSLVDDGIGPGQDTNIFADLEAGDYTVGEQVLNRWVLLSISCSSNQREPFSVAFPATEITIEDLQPGEAVSCTFTNNKPNFEEEPTTIYLPLIVK